MYELNINPVCKVEDSGEVSNPKLIEENTVIEAAIAILKNRISTKSLVLDSIHDAGKYLMLRVGSQTRECFGALWLDSRGVLIADEILFVGTVEQTSVYPREVVLAGLKHNAVSVMFYHNHPSGRTKPSRADEMLTSTLKTALSMIGISVHDHIVVSATEYSSMATLGLV